MRANEFLMEVSLENLARTPMKGGTTMGDAAALELARSGALQDETDAVGALELIASADPTNNNSLTRWLAKMFLSPDSDFKIPEDVDHIKTTLTKFVKLKKNKVLTPDEANIENLKSLSMLDDLLSKFDEEDTQSGKESKKQAKQEGIEYIIDDPNFAVLLVTTYKANCLYGAGTTWCTTSKDDPSEFENHTKQGPLYIILDNSGTEKRKYQYHYESNQLRDEENESLTDSEIAQLSKNPGWAKFLNMEIKKHYGEAYEFIRSAQSK